MKTKQIHLSSLVSNEPFPTSSAIEAVNSAKSIPPLVSEIETNRFLVIDSLAKVYKNYNPTTQKVKCIVVPPAFIQRPVFSYFSLQTSMLSQARESYKEVQYVKFLAAQKYESSVAIKSNRGTMIKVYFDVDFGDKTIRYFINPLEQKIGGVFFNPSEALNRFSPESINAERVTKTWGTAEKYDYETLPAIVCITEDGQHCYGIASRLDKKHVFNKLAETSAELEISNDDMPKNRLKSRGVIRACSVLVLYPNGETYEGVAKVSENSILMLWSEKLIADLINSEWTSEYFKRDWWQNPTSLIMNDHMKLGCARIEHTCNDCGMVK